MDTTRIRVHYDIKKYYKLILISILSLILFLAAAFFNNKFVGSMPIENFLMWHNIFEFSTILVLFSIFTVTYFIYEESGSMKMMILGSSFLLMACLDIFHTFAYKGMPYFFIANDTSNRAITLWILSRLIGSLTFMIAIFIPEDFISNIKKEVFAISTVSLSIILFFIVTYYPNLFPTMYIDGQGLTLIKIILEYIVMIILAITFISIAKQYNTTSSNDEYPFMIALVLLMFSTFAFTNYGSVYDAFNYIGHLYKVIAYVILYKAIYIQSVSTPYREMKRAKNDLKKYSDNLNVIVEQRTKKLEELNGLLLNDIEYAKEVQRSLLPEKMPKDSTLSFNAEYLPADHLSGDFYNVIRLDKENIAIYIGDVSGHGISAAMLTVFAHQNITQLKEKDEFTEEIIEPGSVLENIYNSYNNTNIGEEKYIVMLYGIYNVKEKSFKYSSAGINVEPYIIKKSGELCKMNVKGFPICKLGEFVNPSYDNKTIYLETGDKILFYSDGLVEAKGKNGEAYGHNNFTHFLKHNHALNSNDLNRALKNDFFSFIGRNKELIDDVTFLTMAVVS